MPASLGSVSSSASGGRANAASSSSSSGIIENRAIAPGSSIGGTHAARTPELLAENALLGQQLLVLRRRVARPRLAGRSLVDDHVRGGRGTLARGHAHRPAGDAPR